MNVLQLWRFAFLSFQLEKQDDKILSVATLEWSDVFIVNLLQIDIHIHRLKHAFAFVYQKSCSVFIRNIWFRIPETEKVFFGMFVAEQRPYRPVGCFWHIAILNLTRRKNLIISQGMFLTQNFVADVRAN